MKIRIYMLVFLIASLPGQGKGGIFFPHHLLSFRVMPQSFNLLAIEDTPTSILLSWSSGGGTTSDYVISYLSGVVAPASCKGGTVIPATTVNGTFHFVTGLTANTSYSFRVCAVDSRPNMATGATVTLKTPVNQSIFRSTGFGQTSAKATGAGNSMTIANSVVTFANALAGNIGVGDAIQYDSDGNASLDAVAFIHGRLSAKSFLVKTAAGAVATSAGANTTWGLFRAYTSAANAQSQTENTGINAAVRNFDANLNLTSPSRSQFIAVYADAIDTATPVVMKGWTTGASNKLTLFAPYDIRHVGIRQRHAGIWNTASYSTLRNTNNEALHMDQSYIVAEGLQLENVTANDYEDIVSIGDSVTLTSAVVELRENIAFFNTSTSLSNGQGFNCWGCGAGTKIYFSNNIIMGPTSGNGSAAIGTNLAAPAAFTYYAYNNTIVGRWSYGIRMVGGGSAAVAYAKNNIVQNTLTSAYSTASGGSFHASSNYNLGGDASTPGGANHRASKTVSFVNAAGRDFHLDAADTAATNYGTDLSADGSYAIADDVDGTPRALTWDIGADSNQIGYFVMSSGTWDGQLGGLDGANEKCLADLTANSWLGKADAQVDADHVRAFLCDGLNCNNLEPGMTYAFALSGSPTSGGKRFITDSDGAGPGSTYSWSSATTFDTAGTASTGRAVGVNNLWPLTPTIYHCSGWTNKTALDWGTGGTASGVDTGTSRWNNGDYPCNTAKRLICSVRP